MRETYEFRVVEGFAHRLFRPAEGKMLESGIRLVEIASDDPRFQEIGNLQGHIRRECNRSFFFGWDIKRRYSQQEMNSADLFNLGINTTFEPAGEGCGTKYDESSACSKCRSGARQVSDLFLNWKRIPKRKDISRTIAGEIVVSKRLVELFGQQRVKGAEFRPVRQSLASSAESKDWFQMIMEPAEAEIAPPTRVGVNPFDYDRKGDFRCPLGDLIGLNLLSELSIRSTTRGTNDIICTRQFIGTRRGLLRPERIILISPKVRRLLESNNLKGYGIEVTHLV
jgi:hypothetical protein